MQETEDQIKKRPLKEEKPSQEQLDALIKEGLSRVKKITDYCYQIDRGFVENMNVCGYFYVSPALAKLAFDEFEQSLQSGGVGGFLPAIKQIANVASLPGVLGGSIGLPDIHSGYGFAIGNVAAMDMESGVVNPGGVGFDINCGVRLIRTNLMEVDIEDKKEQLAQALFDSIPVGVGRRSSLPLDEKSLVEVLKRGIQWSVENGYAWQEDVLHCEEQGCMAQADPDKVSKRAKQRGLSQMGTLGAGNHYAEIQVVEEIYDEHAAKVMGIGKVGQVCIMIHSGSRGLGHQVASDALQDMEKIMARDGIKLNDRQLACAKIASQEGQEYIAAMAAAANFAWVNRQAMTHMTRKAFESVLGKKAEEMDMHVVYDVSHNIAKIEEHVIPHSGSMDLRKVLVHRKGSTRAFAPHHPLIPADYQEIGQPVLVGGTMGTCSFVLTGTEKGMRETFGSTCHGAGRALSRNKARGHLKPEDVMDALKAKNISIRVSSPKLITEESPESYKDVIEVVETCHQAGISKKCVKLRPIAVIKG